MCNFTQYTQYTFHLTLLLVNVILIFVIHVEIMYYDVLLGKPIELHNSMVEMSARSNVKCFTA